MPSKSSGGFFEGKRPWSAIKDSVLQGYLTPYLAKVNRLGQRVLLVDGFAGPGLFDDGTEGSPIIMCRAAHERAGSNYRAIFVNKERAYHDRLVAALAERGYTSNAQAIHGDARALLRELPGQLSADTAFIYLDPFGLEGADFALLEPILSRPPHHSTEILLNLSVPILHRLASRKARAKGAVKPLVIRYGERLTRLFGGDYWQDYLLQADAETHERESALISAYTRKLRGYLRYVGYCPVRETAGGRTKYYLIFASRHHEAIRLMNDRMAKDYHSHVYGTATEGTLFSSLDYREAGTLPEWQYPPLREVILEAVTAAPGLTRADLWIRIISDVNDHEHFGHYTEKEYRDAVRELYKRGEIQCTDLGPTKQLNDQSRLLPA